MSERCPIPGFVGFYEASIDGEIYSVARVIGRGAVGALSVRERRLSPATTKNGYLKVHLRKDGKSGTFLVHRLVLGAFIDMPDAPNNLVNHKNGVRTDNSLANLEWCNKSENALHAYSVLGVQHAAMPKGELSAVAKAVIGTDVRSGYAVRFGSMTDAVECGYTISGISSCVTGKQKTHRQMIWSLAQP